MLSQSMLEVLLEFDVLFLEFLYKLFELGVLDALYAAKLILQEFDLLLGFGLSLLRLIVKSVALFGEGCLQFLVETPYLSNLALEKF